jgi:hypothetical protein
LAAGGKSLQAHLQRVCSKRREVANQQGGSSQQCSEPADKNTDTGPPWVRRLASAFHRAQQPYREASSRFPKKEHFALDFAESNVFSLRLPDDLGGKKLFRSGFFMSDGGLFSYDEF